ncbi:MAG: BlaI/MecI/CopY family transcriptional regulator [Oscillospiraceae bacterium]
MKLTDCEIQIMELFWSEKRALSGADIVRLSPKEKLWKDNSIYIMIQMLLKKNAIVEIGAIKGESGKYLRAFEATISREDYYSDWLIGNKDEKTVCTLIASIISKSALSEGSINALEQVLKDRKTK